MIQLTPTTHSPGLDGILNLARRNFGAQMACAWMSGKGPWDRFLQRMPGHDAHYSFLKSDGNYRHTTATAMDILDTDGLYELRTAVTAILRAEFPNSGQLTGRQPCAIILRPNAYIVLFPQPGRDLYVPFADASGHELIADVDLLERDFPGIFQVAA